jgi:glycine dehydrogenase subunit 1
VYLSLLGKHGLKKVAELCYHKAHYAAEKIAEVKGFQVLTEQPFFNEFVVKCPKPAKEINADLLEYGILGGYDLGDAYGSRMERSLLVAVTEMNTREDIETLVDALAEVTHD